MLKYKCSSCGQQVVAMSAPNPAEMKCPRCGGITDTTRSGAPSETDAPPQGAKVGELIETERQAAQRRAMEEAAISAQRDAEALASYEKRNEKAARINQLGGPTPNGAQPKAWVMSLFVYAAVFMVVAAGVVAFFQSSDNSTQVDDAFAQVEHGAAAEHLAKKWATRLFPHNGAQVYTVVYDTVTEPRSGLVMIKGTALGGREPLTNEQIVALKTKAEPSRTSVAQLKDDVKLIKDAYDPDKMSDAVAGSKSSPKTQPDKPAPEDELRGLGYDDDVIADVNVLREPFVCVVQQNTDGMAGPGGVAMDYFVWKSEGTRQQLTGAAAAAVNAAAEHVFANINSGAPFHPLLDARTAADAERMFPQQYKPQAWRALRSDQLGDDAARVFVRVKDANVNLSGTWLIDMVDRGEGWLVTNTHPPQ